MGLAFRFLGVRVGLSWSEGTGDSVSHSQIPAISEREFNDHSQ